MDVARDPESPDAASGSPARRDALYAALDAGLCAAVERLARGYEANEARRQELVQEIHVALWRSFATFDERCSTRTWVLRVAHNVASTHVARARRAKHERLVGLEELAELEAPTSTTARAESRLELERVLGLVRALAPVDRQVFLLWLEGEDAAAIAEVTGLGAANVATKVHRIKKLLHARSEEKADG